MSGTEDGRQAIGLGYLRLVGIAALIGIPAAFVAALLLSAVHIVQRWPWEDLPGAMGTATPPWYLILGLPVRGALIVAVARRASAL